MIKTSASQEALPIPKHEVDDRFSRSRQKIPQRGTDIEMPAFALLGEAERQQ